MCGGDNLLHGSVCNEHLNWELCSLIIVKPQVSLQSMVSYKPLMGCGLAQPLWQWPFSSGKKKHNRERKSQEWEVVHVLHKTNVCEVSAHGAVTSLRPWWQSGLQEKSL